MAQSTIRPHQLLDLRALHYARKVYKNHTVRLHGRVIDIPRRADSAHAIYAGKDVLVKRLLAGDYRIFYGAECIAWAGGVRLKPSTNSRRTTTKKNDGGDIFTEQLMGANFTVL